MYKLIQEHLESYLLEKKINTCIDFEILKGKEEMQSDYSSNILFKILKSTSKDREKIMKDILVFFESNYRDIYDKVFFAKNGFINFRIKDFFIWNYFINENSILLENAKHSRKINFEFISANPTGNLHIGHARNAVVGDVLSRIYEHKGNKVIREYWINDYGNQIKNMAESILYFSKWDKFSNIKPTYVGEDIEVFSNNYININQLKNKTNTEILDTIKTKSINYFLDQIKKTIRNMNLIKFDFFTSEKELYKSGFVDDILQKMIKEKIAYYGDNKNVLWLDTKQPNNTINLVDEKDRVLVKSDNTNTYLVSDIAFHIKKYQKGYDEMINVWGSDHHGYIPRLKIAINKLGFDETKLRICLINMVKVKSNNEIVKMSKRQGTNILINDILKIINNDIFKFFLLSKKKDQPLTIDLDEMKKQSTSNPYYYFQYSNIRLNSIIKKINLEGKCKKINKNINNKMVLSQKTRAIIIKAFEFDQVLNRCINDLEPSYLLNYSLEMSALFHSFYNDKKIIDMNKSDLCMNNLFLNQLKNTNKILFKLLGISILEKM